MKRIIATSIVFIATSTWATNGGNLIGISPSSQGLGGTGIANYTTGADALFKNPSLLTALPGADGSVTGEVYGTLFKQNGSVEPASGATSAGEKISQNKAVVLPTLGATYKFNNQAGFGLSVGGYGGARADYRGEATLSRLFAEASHARVTMAGAYRILPEVSLGVAPFMNYSELRINLTSGPAPHGDTSFGAIFGVSAEPIANLTIGATYQLKTTQTHEKVLDLGALSGVPTGLKPLDSGEPQQLGVGVAYDYSDWTFTADYRLLCWNSTEGYKQLGWQNQSVIALGTQYKMNDWAFRLGFNHGNSPIEDKTGETIATPTTISGVTVYPQSISLLNMGAFPAISATHLAGGMGYNLTADLSLDAAFVYAFKKTAVRSGTGSSPLTGAAGAYTYTARVSQWSAAAGLSYRF